MSNDPLERQLRALTPTGPDLDRDALLYRMGRASAPRPTLWMWQLTSAVALLFALGIALAWWQQPTPAPLVVERIIVREVPVEVPVVVPSPGDILSLWGGKTEPRELPRARRIEEQISRHGLDAVPAAVANSPRTPTMTELLQSLSAFD